MQCTRYACARLKSLTRKHAGEEWDGEGGWEAGETGREIVIERGRVKGG